MGLDLRSVQNKGRNSRWCVIPRRRAGRSGGMKAIRVIDSREKVQRSRGLGGEQEQGREGSRLEFCVCEEVAQGHKLILTLNWTPETEHIGREFIPTSRWTTGRRRRRTTRAEEQSKAEGGGPREEADDPGRGRGRTGGRGARGREGAYVRRV